ncbi:MAG: FKBP-type peptidyl-prolyl cis-trans isomerase [Gammaproteobacteria bacterium]
MKRYFYFLAAFLLSLSVSLNAAAAGKKLTNDKARLSYAIGVRIGDSLKRQGLDKELDPAILTEAISDMLKGHKLRQSEKETEAVLKKFQEREQAKHKAEMAKRKAQMQKEGKIAKAEGDKFRAKFRKEKGVKVTKSGIMYKILKEGKGKKPKADDKVSVNYTGKLVNGKVFDSSYKRGRPATFPVNGVIPGWTEILQMMPVGSKWQVVIPPELAYGDHGAGGVIRPGETLVFDIELLSIKK